jgi:hypothetical protein
MFRPPNFKVLGQPNTAGVIRGFPVNKYELLTRKGVSVLANQPIQNAYLRTVAFIPAGSDAYDAVNIKAMLSCHIGMVWAIAQGISDTVLTGTL